MTSFYRIWSSIITIIMKLDILSPKDKLDTNDTLLLMIHPDCLPLST